MSLRFRLNCILFFTIATLVLSGTALVIFNARQSVRNEIESTLHLAVQLIRSGMVGESVDSISSRDFLQSLENSKRIRHLKIDIRSSGTVSEDIVFDSASLDRVPEWFVWSVAPQPGTFNKSIQLVDFESREVLIQADPGDEIAEAWNEAVDLFALIAGMGGLVFVLVTMTVERAFRPVSVILGGLDRLENVRYHEPLPEFPLPEFTRIARAINRTAAALEKVESENKRLRQHSFEVREQERQFLARELHDEFGQSLSAIKVLASSLKNEAFDGPAISALGSIQATCDHLFAVLSNMLRRLHPLILDDLGLKASLDDMLENCSTHHPSLSLDYRCDPAIDGFRRKLQIQLFRIVQECLTNIVKHANANRVLIRVGVDGRDNRASDRSLRIEVRDNGAGFDAEAVQSGFGLRGIRERVEGLGGETMIRSAPGRGVEIEIDIPFARDGE